MQGSNGGTTVGDIVALIEGAPDVRLALDRHPLPLTPTLLPELKLEVDRLVNADRQKASRLVEAAAWAASRLGDTASLAFADASRARLLYAEANYRDAEPLFVVASRTLKAAGREIDAAALAKQHLQTLMYLGRYAEAFAVARDARRALVRSKDLRLLAEHETNVGNLYYRVDRHRKALACYDRAWAIFADLGDDVALAQLEQNRAAVLHELDRIDEALDLYARARARYDAHGVVNRVLQVDLAVAFIAYLRGHYHEALRRFTAANDAGAGSMNTAEQALTDLDLSEVYLQLNAVDEARAAARSAVSACVACGRAREASAARRLLAITEALSGDLVESLRIFDEVVAEFDAAGLDAQSAVTRLERASVALRAGNAAGALESARAAADALGRASLGPRRRQARVVEARALLALGDHTAAIRVARATIRSARNRHGDHATYQCHHVIALAEVARGRQTAALNAYRKAIASVEALRSRIGVDDFKSRFLEDKVDLFEGAVALCLEMGTPDLVTEALRTLELAKSRSLSDLLADYLREAAPGTEQSRAARERFKALVDELAWYTSRRERDEPGSDGARREARRRSHELETCEARVADAFRQLQVEDPRFADLHAPGVVDPKQLQALIDPGDALVEYAQTGETYSAIVVTSDGIRACRDLASIAEVNRLLDGVRFQMEKFAFGRDFASRELGHLRQGADLYLARLHDALLGPIGSLVGNRNLIVVPHGRLHYVPMHALRSANGYVIEERAVSYAPSATVYALCAAAPSRPAGPALICGVEDASIPEIAREIEALRGLFPNATVLAGPDATRQAVVRHAEHSRVLHIASHARFRSDNPMLSSLRLADGDLTFYDVFSLKLAADLVVLSGCNTGAVAVGAGDELHGLMRGFLYAGAPSLLISMWAADDSATASLMRDFYSGIRDGLPKRDALRSAQLAALGREQHPYYWAPFTLLGRAT